ncbi:unnamed protein product [Psylliodes chrysocephalus]|uniref:Poly [ADP-ribose] polymerase n=1 Tax=Psylliodes chrysocephalus TaxID=3402493 RepID=A0A9P0GF04_9CUCU|nr:unnamed protein product [Psylliodes chrysocephala]
MESDITDKFNKLSIKKKIQNGNMLIVDDPTIMKINVVQTVLMGNGQNCESVSKVLSYRNILPTSREFMELEKVFLKEKLLIESAKAVVNPYIKQSFELKRICHYNDITPLLLYHGTKEKYVDSICTFNFNWRYSGFETGYKFGKGVNFSDKPTYSSMFCDKKKLKGVIIVADVLIKTVAPGNPNFVLPPKGADTTIGKGTRVIVKFNDNEFCPKYVVRFVKKKGG